MAQVFGACDSADSGTLVTEELVSLVCITINRIKNKSTSGRATHARWDQVL
ncbi:hypothetical protein GCM10008940_20760 [Microbulbifer agarilyticus]